MDTQTNQTGCCPKFDPTPWDGKMFSWQGKKFIKDSVCTLFYLPLNFGAVMMRLTTRVERAGAASADGLCLSDHTSKWNMDLYLAVEREVPGAEHVAMSGNFVSKVYEGPFKNTGAWLKDFTAYTKSRGLAVKKTYFWYTTCPKCAKVYGKNHIVIIGQL